LPEVLGMSDRIMVMSGGKIAGELPKDTSQDDIMALAVSNLSSAASAESVHDHDHDAAFSTLKEDSQ